MVAALGSRQYRASAQALKIPEAQRRAPWAPVSRFSFFKRINQRSRYVPPQLNSALDGVGGSQNHGDKVEKSSEIY